MFKSTRRDMTHLLSESLIFLFYEYNSYSLKCSKERKHVLYSVPFIGIVELGFEYDEITVDFRIQNANLRFSLVPFNMVSTSRESP